MLRTITTLFSSIYEERKIRQIFVTAISSLLLIFVLQPYIEFSKQKKEKTEQTEKSETIETKEEAEQTKDKWQDKKRSGKNEPHKNQDTKESLQKQIDEAKAKIKELNTKKANDNSLNAKREIDRLERMIKNIQNEIKRKAETHGKKGK